MVYENNRMQVSIVLNYNKKIGGTTLGYCFERFF